jgi:hypothetical protein
MEFLIESWEWIKAGRELQVAGIIFVIGVLYAVIVRRVRLCVKPEQK